MRTSKIKDPFGYLIEDHKNMALLIEAAVSAAPAERRARFSEIKDALTLHMELEETAVYPALKGREGTRTQAMESKEEHQLMKALLAGLSALPPEGDAWAEKLRMFKADLEHHVNEEEGSFFPKARKELSKEEEEMVRREMERFVAALPARAQGRNVLDEDPTEKR